MSPVYVVPAADAAGWTALLAHNLAAHLAATVPELTYRVDGAYEDGETGLVHKVMPPAPDRVVVVTVWTVPNGGLSDVLTAVQVRCRGLPRRPLDPDDLDDAVYRELHGARDLILGPARLSTVWRQSGPAQLGTDQNGRAETTSTYYAHAGHPSAHVSD